MADSLYETAVRTLEDSGASMRCSELTDLLESLGFTVRDGKLGGHKVFVHDGLPDFKSGSYNCDHGRNPQIKRPYITKVLRVLREHEDDIKKFLKKR